MKVLVDSSIWIDYFRTGGHKSKLDLLIDNNVICTCGIVLAELIPFLAQKNQKELIVLLKQIPLLDMVLDWEAIISYQQVCLAKGIHNVGIPDLLLVDVIIKNGAALFTKDKHFQLINKHISFELYDRITG